jgi:hypothetical protein
LILLSSFLFIEGHGEEIIQFLAFHPEYSGYKIAALVKSLVFLLSNLISGDIVDKTYRFDQFVFYGKIKNMMWF